jgi:plasmid stabilization system protein ParE
VKRIVWTDLARSDVRNLSKSTAMQILSALHRFASNFFGAFRGRGRPRHTTYFSETNFSTSSE